ncbi:MAG: NUDIX domain-containing protein [Bacteroidales bacterium OttesenSCG-928-I14]|jgi:isopentenyl-diphosphate delta-isomerase type 1|nr:NUDIX domain-containing protein [Bacteroidales bacterium OttesenSCG-928-I14]
MFELCPLVDKFGNTIGSATRNDCHNGNKLLHPVVHLHIFNEKGELLLQKRASHKYVQPKRWDTSVGGHVKYGEKIEDALTREAYEELNIKNFIPYFIKSYIFESNIEQEKIYSYKTTYMSSPVYFNTKEIESIRFWNLEEIIQNIGKNLFTPNFEYEFCFHLFTMR